MTRARSSEARPPCRNRLPVALAATLLLAGGCRATMPAGATSQPSPSAGSAELLAHAAAQPLVSAELGYRVIYALWKGEVFGGDFASLSTALAERRIIDPAWRLGPDVCLDRATVGYMVCRAIGIRSGANWMLTGLGRYAWRELQYRNIAGPGGESGLVSGGEFVGLVARADDYAISRHKDLTRRAELGQRPQ